MKTLISSTLLSLMLLSSCGGSQTETSKTKGSEKTIYSCTMHHEVREEKPGQCPQCGMNLVVVDDISHW